MRIFPVVSVLLFIAACFLPALEFSRKTYSGGDILIVGWFGIMAGCIACYANPVWLFALIMAFVGKNNLALIVGFIALAIGCTTFLLFGRQLGSEWSGDVSGNHYEALVRVLPGCYLWLLSLVAVPAGVFFPNAKF
jgi:hypothetical protein